MLGAAADTTGHSINVATIEVTQDPAKYKCLSAELKKAFPDPNAKLDYATPEKLPYLVGPFFSSQTDSLTLCRLV